MKSPLANSFLQKNTNDHKALPYMTTDNKHLHI
jgi:hypothetical protein